MRLAIENLNLLGNMFSRSAALSDSWIIEPTNPRLLRVEWGETYAPRYSNQHGFVGNGYLLGYKGSRLASARTLESVLRQPDRSEA